MTETGASVLGAFVVFHKASEFGEVDSERFVFFVYCFAITCSSDCSASAFLCLREGGTWTRVFAAPARALPLVVVNDHSEVFSVNL
jgi:hypothetical protein